MKKRMVSVFLFFVICFGVNIAYAKEDILQGLTGQVWQASSLDNKTAFIYGIESAVAIEYVTAEHIAQKKGHATDKQSVVKSLTAFPQSWIMAFDGMDKKSIVGAIDAWYAKHSNQLQKPVLDVLWYEIMEPKLAKK